MQHNSLVEGIISAILDNYDRTGIWPRPLGKVVWENLEVLHLYRCYRDKIPVMDDDSDSDSDTGFASSCSIPLDFRKRDYWDLRFTSYYLPKLRSVTFENALPHLSSPIEKLPENWNDITIKCCDFVTTDVLEQIQRMVLWWSAEATGESDGDLDLSPKHLLLWDCNNIDKMFIQCLRRIGSSNINIEWR